MDTGLLLLRVVLGLTLAAHGGQKLFGWFGGHGIEGTSGWLESMGFRPARLQAIITGLAEFGGGLLVALGLLTSLGALALAGVMVVAVVTVHWSKGFFATGGGYEFNLLIWGAAIALAFTGPGTYSVDHAIGWAPWGAGWGWAVAAAGFVSAGVVLASRKSEVRTAQTA
jgi:putative oxidoreductase